MIDFGDGDWLPNMPVTQATRGIGVNLVIDCPKIILGRLIDSPWLWWLIGWLINVLLVVANLLYFIIGLLNRWVAENIRNKVGRQGPRTRHPQSTKPYFPISIPTNTFPISHYRLILCCFHGEYMSSKFVYSFQTLYSSHFSHARHILLPFLLQLESPYKPLSTKAFYCLLHLVL